MAGRAWGALRGSAGVSVVPASAPRAASGPLSGDAAPVLTGADRPGFSTVTCPGRCTVAFPRGPGASCSVPGHLCSVVLCGCSAQPRRRAVVTRRHCLLKSHSSLRLHSISENTVKEKLNGGPRH